MNVDLTREVCTILSKGARLEARLRGTPTTYSNSPFHMAVGLRLCEIVDRAYGFSSFGTTLSEDLLEYDEDSDVFIFPCKIKKGGTHWYSHIVKIPRSWLWLSEGALTMAWKNNGFPKDCVDAV